MLCTRSRRCTENQKEAHVCARGGSVSWLPPSSGHNSARRINAVSTLLIQNLKQLATVARVFTWKKNNTQRWNKGISLNIRRIEPTPSVSNKTRQFRFSLSYQTVRAIVALSTDPRVRIHGCPLV